MATEIIGKSYGFVGKKNFSKLEELMEYSLPEGLDQRFLKFIGVTEETERIAHTAYLKFFRPGQHVLDLGCGAGYFVKMLLEQGVEAQGIDMDPAAIQEAKAQDLPVFQAEGLDYLQNLPDESLDAIFCAHLVEHLEVEAVYQLIKEANRVLKPSGFLLLTTPNVRALVSHLEMFWLHFDHKRFYHPRLLEFFMKECNFDEVIYGENLEGQNTPNSWETDDKSQWDSAIPKPRYLFMLPWWWFKTWLARMIVLPYLARYIPLQIASRSFEVYVIGSKTPTDKTI